MPDSCCKTVVTRCGQRAHPSNIYKVEVSAQGPGHPGTPAPNPRGTGTWGLGAQDTHTDLEARRGPQWSAQSPGEF